VQPTGVLSGAGGDGAASSVDVRDVAAVAAHVLCTDGHAVDRSAGMPEWHAGALVELQAVIGRDEFATVTDEVTKATGRPARTAAAFFADHQAAFA
jgi:hypothetical protein